MKQLLMAALVLAGSSAAMADTTLFTCTVPNSTSVTLTINKSDDQSVDFLTVQLNEKVPLQCSSANWTKAMWTLN